jgi:hypothetical protein
MDLTAPFQDTKVQGYSTIALSLTAQCEFWSVGKLKKSDLIVQMYAACTMKICYDFLFPFDASFDDSFVLRGGTPLQIQSAYEAMTESLRQMGERSFS